MSGDAAGRTPRIAVVYGALRSGTTLLRLMLDAHPRIACPGESDWLFDHLVADGAGGWRLDRAELAADRIFRAAGIALPAGAEGAAAVRAMAGALAAGRAGPLVLMTHRHPGRVLEIFPGAPVIHLLRDPRDVARSAIGMGWAGTVYHGLDTWLGTERAWDAVAPALAPGQALTLTYEALIRAPEAALSRAAAHLGEAWDPAMLSYDRSTTYAAPDPALGEQWRRRLSRREIGLIEGRAGALLAARGYAPSGHPAVHPGRGERLRLWAADKAGVWRRRLADHGPVDPVLYAAARRLGLHALARRVRRRIDARIIATLK